MIQQLVQIENELGLHARAAARLVKLASGFESEVKLARAGSDEQIDGKSILGVLVLAAGRGTQLRLTVSGRDEKQAMEALISLIQGRFGEKR